LVDIVVRMQKRFCGEIELLIPKEEYNRLRHEDSYSSKAQAELQAIEKSLRELDPNVEFMKLGFFSATAGHILITLGPPLIAAVAAVAGAWV
jgi:hypothetical protein